MVDPDDDMRIVTRLVALRTLANTRDSVPARVLTTALDIADTLQTEVDRLNAAIERVRALTVEWEHAYGETMDGRIRRLRSLLPSPTDGSTET